ncbi:MAG: hypothetical protein J7493_08380 [Porphyrobacter sp.]|nr:hypothetical protein [Porphyrobacter sp.]
MRYAVAVLLLALAGCDGAKDNRTSDNRICSTPPQPVSGDWNGCIHKWAYRLAVGDEASEIVAEAVVTACADAIAWQVNNEPENQRTMTLEAINRSAPKIALFRVVQARAGGCQIP